MTLTVGWLGVATADAKPKKKDASSQKGKKSKSGKGSMDETAGQSDGDLAPGSDDAKAKSGTSGSSSTKSDKSKPAEKEAAPAEPDPVSAPPAEAPKEEAAPAPEPEPEGPKIQKNWITLGFQQDALFFTPVSNVCDSTDADGDEFPGNPQYSCRDGSGLYDGAVYSGSGNEIQSGIGLATARIYVGYDRVFIERLTVGARLGFAFGGMPTVVGGGTFNPLHAEVRSSFFFGNTPFERAGFRPYASLGVGVGEIDGKVSVDFFVDQEGYQDGERGQLDAWRQTGIGFGALGLGVGYPVGPLMPTLELRGIMMFGEPAFAMGLAGNIAYGI
ncbi:MAG TPA: hypothetical protein VFZ53_32805 [Polyangiaceae bacterium]